MPEWKENGEKNKTKHLLPKVLNTVVMLTSAYQHVNTVTVDCLLACILVSSNLKRDDA